MRWPRWLGGQGVYDPDEDELAARAEDVRRATARLLTETKRQIAALERRQQRGHDGHSGHAGA